MKKIIYPGTFDPIHNGHLDIALRASKLFDQLEFVLALNSEKKPLFSTKKRLMLIEEFPSGDDFIDTKEKIEKI